MSIKTDAKPLPIEDAKNRDIVKTLEQSRKNYIIFYGSQTGTAEDYASRLAKEGKSRFGLATIVVDLEDYDYDNPDAFQFITANNVLFSNALDMPLKSLTEATCGLGNNTHENYSSVVRHVDKALRKLGVRRLGDAGAGDDGVGLMEDDFLEW